MNPAPEPKFFRWSHARRARFFHELGSMMGPGALPPLRCLEVFLRGSRPRYLRRLAEAARERIRQGGTLAEALGESREFEAMDIAILRIGEQAGNLPEMLQMLGDHHERRHRQLSELLISAAYPLFLLHGAIIIPAIVQWFNLGFGAFLLSAGRGLAGLYAALAVVWLLFKLSSQSGPAGVAIGAFLHAIPWLGGLLRKLELQRFLAALSCLYNAGLPLPRAVEESARTVQSAILGRRLRRAVERLKAGEPLSAALEPVGLPPAIQAMLETGEESGALDTMLRRTADLLAQENDRTQRTMAVVIGIVLLLGAVSYAAWMVVSMWMNSPANQMMQDLLKD